ncbi:hypothetical protein F4824DRAFT_484500 [Ustulina deusta]|nr:hypothetical protein F4823DRAFT_614610 [Ustulina deusta]KAI3328174.1 hypothetical protein F4824DRAFT_484500 [Ustulina deusta]
MQLRKLTHMTSEMVSFLAIAACFCANVAVSQVTVGFPCDTAGAYNCANGFADIAVCSVGHWQLAAVCTPRLCYWPADYPTPFCE